MLEADMSVPFCYLGRFQQLETSSTRYSKGLGASPTYVPNLQVTSHHCIGAVTPLVALLRAELCDNTLDMPCPGHVVPDR